MREMVRHYNTHTYAQPLKGREKQNSSEFEASLVCIPSLR